MLIFLIVSIVLRLTFAKSFFDDCPVDREKRSQLLDNDRLFDVLHTFYNDLSYVRASTELGERHNFIAIIEEIQNIVPSDPQGEHVMHGLELIAMGRHDEADAVLRGPDDTGRAPRHLKSYTEFLAAVSSLMLGCPVEALEMISVAANIRRLSKGVSLNELERLDGLIMLQRVFKFNRDVDKLYGFSRDQSFAALGRIHSVLKNRVDSFRDMRPVEQIRVLDTNSRIISSLRRREIGESSSRRTFRTAVLALDNHLNVDPEQGDFHARSVPKTFVEYILCEFAQKLAILVPNSGVEGGTHYSTLIDQLSEIDTRYAKEFDTKVVQNLADGDRQSAMKYIDSFDDPSILRVPEHLFETLRTYANYFEVESYQYDWIIDHDCEKILDADILLQDIKMTRISNRGVSLDRLFELEARILVKLIKCFHERLIAVYRLNGRESEQELDTKRDRNGGCDSYFPLTTVI